MRLILVVDTGAHKCGERLLEHLSAYLGTSPVDLGDLVSVGAKYDPCWRRQVEDLRRLLDRTGNARERYHLGQVDVDILQCVRVVGRLLGERIPAVDQEDLGLPRPGIFEESIELHGVGLVEDDFDGPYPRVDVEGRTQLAALRYDSPYVPVAYVFYVARSRRLGPFIILQHLLVRRKPDVQAAPVSYHTLERYRLFFLHSVVYRLVEPGDEIFEVLGFVDCGL